MRFLILSALLPLVLGCDDPSTDPCAAAFTASSAKALAFCATYTKSVVTATTNLPAFASQCSLKPKKISSACSCLTGGAHVATSSQIATSAHVVTSVHVVTSAHVVPTKATTLKTITSAAKKPTQTTLAAVKSTAKTIPKSTAATNPKATSTGTACTVTAFAGISSAVASCSNIVLSAISVPASSSMDLSKLKTGATVTFAGKTTFGTTANEDLNPIVISGTDITITGAAGHVIDGNGQAYWDGKGSNGGSAKPDHFIVAKKLVNAVFSNLNIQNYPVHCFDITGGDTILLENIILDNSAGNAANSISGGKPAAHNSDGFDISSTDNLILKSSKVYNQDDCVAITSGTNITVDNMFCSGGHGLSIGSIGGKSDNDVNRVTFSNSVVVNSENGARIKSNSGTTGSITNIVYNNITMSGISDYGIDIQQDYLNGGATGKPTNGVKISDVSFTDVTGTMTSKGQDYYVLCGSGSCSGFSFSGVSITGGGVASSCNYPSTTCP